MNLLGRLLKTIFVPVTIMLVPHSRSKPFGIRIPVAGIFVSVLMFLVGITYVFSVSIRTVEYYRMKETLSGIASHYEEIQSTVHSLNLVEDEFRRLFQLKSKKAVLEAADFSDTGSLDMELLKEQISAAMESATDIRRYVMEQKDIYLATPAGFPVDGHVSSAYGPRKHPKTGNPGFHSGVDISTPAGLRVRATADGIVIFSGWTAGSGHTIVIEHGHGFRTAFGHNKRNLVKVGQRVKRNEEIAVSGSTGISTGPHVHYEIWKNGRHVNPATYVGRG
ncbi:MAG: M23 family metallopeptidase [Deltaproteobacteria bacterium]|nr:M23 family metallopeptidase [Deltaproteobacteria bacterium]